MLDGTILPFWFAFLLLGLALTIIGYGRADDNQVKREWYAGAAFAFAYVLGLTSVISLLILFISMLY